VIFFVLANRSYEKRHSPFRQNSRQRDSSTPYPRRPLRRTGYHWTWRNL